MVAEGGLTRLQLALLVLYGSVGWQRASAYSVEVFLRNMSGVVHFGKSAAYAQSRRLAKDGYLVAVMLEEDRPRPTTAYRLSPKGKAAVEGWLLTPPDAAFREAELFLRLRATSFVNAEVGLRGLSQMRPLFSKQLAVADAREVELGDRAELCDQLEIRLTRSVTKARLSWLTRAEKGLRDEVRFQEREARIAKLN